MVPKALTDGAPAFLPMTLYFPFILQSRFTGCFHFLPLSVFFPSWGPYTFPSLCLECFPLSHLLSPLLPSSPADFCSPLLFQLKHHSLWEAFPSSSSRLGPTPKCSQCPFILTPIKTPLFSTIIPGPSTELGSPSALSKKWLNYCNLFERGRSIWVRLKVTKDSKDSDWGDKDA